MIGKRLFVGGLPYRDFTEEDLRARFSRAGRVESVCIMLDWATGRSRGFGFVEMATFEEAEAAVRLFDGSRVFGRTLTVAGARVLRRTPDLAHVPSPRDDLQRAGAGQIRS